MKPKLLSIVGPTAVGKTNFALRIAENFSNCDLIAADSRQVYRGLEIISGADVPENFQAKVMKDWSDLANYFEADNVRLFGISLLEPTESWSVSQFQAYALRVCQLSWNQGRLPIIVGGTGLYQTQLLNADEQLHIPPDLQLRAEAENMSVEELQQLLQQRDPKSLSDMNNSDRHNPRRLLRAIEKSAQEPTTHSASPNVSELTIGLTDSIEAIEDRIQRRVRERVSQGAMAEVERLMATTENQKLPVWSTTGVKALIALATGQINQTTCEEIWTRQERQYAKRQMTWWKKRPNVTWYQIDKSDWQSAAQSQIESWYSA